MNLSTLNTGLIFESLFISFVISILTALLATRFAIRIDLIDRPNAEPHKLHKRPVPVSGGTAFFLTLVISLCIFRKHGTRELWSLTGSAFIIFLFAFYDDLRYLNWKFKLAGQILGSAVLIITGIRTHLFDANIFSSWMPETACLICDILLTTFWILFITNAFNLVDSADGVMIGLSAWAEGFLLIAALDAGQYPLALYCSIMLGSSLSLSFFNANPAFLFMGDSGAQVIGFLLSAVSIIYTPPELLQKNTWFLPILILGVPIFDTVLVTISRWRKGQHFYHSGTDHTYHRLIRLGLSTPQASSFMHLVSFALQSLAFFLISQSVLEANIIFGFVVICGIAAIVFFEREDLWKNIQKIIQTNDRLS